MNIKLHLTVYYYNQSLAHPMNLNSLRNKKKQQKEITRELKNNLYFYQNNLIQSK